MNIATTLSLYRKKAKLSQAELAKIVGVDTFDIINYEKGTETPSTDIIIKISKACDVSIDEIFTFDGESNGI